MKSFLFLLLVCAITVQSSSFYSQVDVEYFKTGSAGNRPISSFSANLASDEARGRTALIGSVKSLWSFIPVSPRADGEWSTTTTTSTTGGGQTTTTSTGGPITITTGPVSGISTTSTGRSQVEGWTTSTTTSTTGGGQSTTTSTGGPITITTGSFSGISTTSTGRANAEEESEWSTTTTTSTTGGGRTTTTSTGGPITITTGSFSGISTTSTGGSGASTTGGRVMEEDKPPKKSNSTVSVSHTKHSNSTKTKTKHNTRDHTKPHPSKPKPSHHGPPHLVERRSDIVGFYERNGKNCQISQTQVPIGLFNHINYFWWTKDAKKSGSCDKDGALLKKQIEINGVKSEIRGCFLPSTVPKWIEIASSPISCRITFKSFNLASFDEDDSTFAVPNICVN